MKNNKISKILSALLAAVLVITTVSFAFSAFADQSGDYTYEILDENTCSVTGYTGSEPDIVIPSEIDGYTVVEIGFSAFEQPEEEPRKTITSVVIPNTVKSIGMTAFFGTNITEIIIPEGVETIEQQAFDACRDLVSATLPSSLVTLGQSAFGSQDTKLQEINVSLENQNYCSVDGIVFSKDMTKLIQYPIGKVAKSYSIPDTVTTIGESAFMECQALEHINIPSSVTVIEDFAFCNTILKEVIIPKNIKGIGSWAFANSYLTTIIILNKTDFEIGEGTFDDGRDNKFQTFIGYAGSGTEKMVNKWLEYAESDDSFEVDFKFVAIEPANLKDNTTGVEVLASKDDTIAYGATLNVTVAEQTETSVKYNITLVADGNEIQPADSVTVKIPVPETFDPETCAVYRMEADGARTDMNAVYENGYMVFSTDHFSEYVITGEIKGTEIPTEPGSSEDSTDSSGQKQNSSGNSDKLVADTNTKVQNASIPDTGAKEQDSIALYVLISAAGAVLFFGIASARAKKQFNK